MEPLGLVLSLLDRAEKTAQSLRNLRDCPKRFHEMYEKLVLVKEETAIANAFIKGASSHTGITASSKKRIENLETRLRKLAEKLEEKKQLYIAHASDSSNAKLRKSLRLAAGPTRQAMELDEIAAELNHIEVILTFVHNFMRVDGSGNDSVDVFIPRFESFSLPHGIVLFFDTVDSLGDPETVEGKLKACVLDSTGASCAATGQASHQSDRGGNSVSTAVGMGGVGKTRALQGLAMDEDVKNRFTDGIYFLSIGQQATAEDVLLAVANIVECSGGKKLWTKVKEAKSLGQSVLLAANWFSDRVCLFICDDLWPIHDGCSIGFLRELKHLLRYAPKSRIVFSTRDKNIAKEAEAENRVEFGSREPLGRASRAILLKNANVSDEEAHDLGVVWNDHVKKVLSLCGGLPLALNIAGAAVAQQAARGNAVYVWAEYADFLWRQRHELTQLDAGDYTSLQAVLCATLDYAEQEFAKEDFAKCSKYSFREIFESLMVARNQGWLHLGTLCRLWNLNDEDMAMKVTLLMNRFHLVSLEPRCWHYDEEEVYSIKLHDLLLESCRNLAEKNDRVQFWHRQLLTGYACDSKEGTFGDFLSVVDDGYIIGNLSRHLVGCSEVQRLEALLCDIRWTMRRADVGSWLGLSGDFQLFEKATEGGSSGIRLLHWVMERSWSYISENRSQFVFSVYGHLSQRERNDPLVTRLLQSIQYYFPKPWLQPVGKCLGPKDSREKANWIMNGYVKSIDACWEGEKVAISTSDSLDVWSMRDQIMFTSIPYSSNVCKLSSDGKLIVSGSSDCTVRRWNAETGESIGEPMRGHEGDVWSVAISRDGKLIVSGSYDRTVRRWNGETGESIGEPLRGHEEVVWSVAISGDGKKIVSGSYNRTVRRWNAETGESIGKPLAGHGGSVGSVAISKDGNQIVSGSADGTVRRWNLETEESVGEPLSDHNHEVRSVAISADGKQIVSGSDDKTVRQWNAETGERIGAPFCGHYGSVWSVSISKDGKRILSGSYDKTVRRWNAETGESIGEPLRGHEDVVWSLAISADGKQIVTGSRDSTVRRWNAETGETIGESLKGHDGSVRCVAISGDGKQIFSGSDDKTVRLWDWGTGESIGEPLRGHSSSVMGLVMSADRKLIASCSYDMTVRWWNAETGESIGEPLRGHEAFVMSLAISSDGKQIVSGSYDKTVRRWNAETGERIGEPLRGHEGIVWSVAISGDGKQIVSGSDDKTVCRWNAETGERIGEPLRGHYRSVRSVAISGDGKQIVSGSDDKTVRLWDSETGELIGNFFHVQQKDTRSSIEANMEVSGNAFSEGDPRRVLPANFSSLAINADKGLYCAGLMNGEVAICRLVA